MFGAIPGAIVGDAQDADLQYPSPALVKSLTLWRQEADLCEYIHVIEDVPGQSARVYLFQRDSIQERSWPPGCKITVPGGGSATPETGSSHARVTGDWTEHDIFRSSVF